MDIVVQRGDLGVGGQTFKISPMTNEEVLNQKSCFLINGTKEAKITAQATLPDAAQFQVRFKTQMPNVSPHLQPYGII